MLLKKCPKCGKLYAYGKPYCPECMPKYEADKAKYKAENAKRYDQKRKGTREYKFYRSDAWKRTAFDTLRKRKYKCERCGEWAEQVHHIQPIKTPEGWERRFDPTNLEILCIRCHNAEHKRFQKNPAGSGRSPTEVLRRAVRPPEK